MSEKKKRGPYKKAGEKTAGVKKSVEVTVDDATVDTMRALAGGNLSAGIRKAADIIRRLPRVDDK